MSRKIATLPGPNAKQALTEYAQDPLGFMLRCAQAFGEIVPLQLEGELFCLLTNPDHITEVLKDRLLFVKAEDLHVLRGLLGNGLLTSEGNFWQRQRRLSQPVFHKQRVDSYATVMVDYTQAMLKSWRAGEIIDVHNKMMRLTLEIVMKTVFNKDVADAEADCVSQALDTAMDWFDAREGSRPNHKLERRYQNAISQLDKTIFATIQQRRASGCEGNDLLGMLMQVQDADDGNRMSDRQLRDEAITTMLAGHETTANTMTWVWMLLAKHPDVRSKLTIELKQVLNGRAPTLADLPQLTYANQIVKEAMRLYPPIAELHRKVTQNCELGGYAIPKGCTLIASQWVMHRNSRYFNNPEIFEPERWTDEFEKQLPRGVYFPFSDGPRICIGKSFAQMEAVLILAAIAQTFHLALAPHQKIEIQPSITLRPKHGIQVLLEKAPKL